MFQIKYLEELTTSISPLDLSPVLWLDASDTSTITESGGAVSQWDNKGSLGNFTQGTGTAQPTSGVSTLNGLNVLNFSGDRFSSTDSSSAWSDLHNGTASLTIAVIKFGTSSDPNALYSIVGNAGYGSASRRGYTFYFDDRAASGMSNALVNATMSGSSDYVTINKAQNTVVPQQWHIVADFVDADASPVVDRSQIFIDNGNSLKSNTYTSSPSSLASTYGFQVGAGGANSFPLTGSIAELIIVTGANATEANRQALRDYLNNKWAVY